MVEKQFGEPTITPATSEAVAVVREITSREDLFRLERGIRVCQLLYGPEPNDEITQSEFFPDGFVPTRQVLAHVEIRRLQRSYELGIEISRADALAMYGPEIEAAINADNAGEALN